MTTYLDHTPPVTTFCPIWAARRAGEDLPARQACGCHYSPLLSAPRPLHHHPSSLAPPVLVTASGPLPATFSQQWDLTLRSCCPTCSHICSGPLGPAHPLSTWRCPRLPTSASVVPRHPRTIACRSANSRPCAASLPHPPCPPLLVSGLAAPLGCVGPEGWERRWARGDHSGKTTRACLAPRPACLLFRPFCTFPRLFQSHQPLT